MTPSHQRERQAELKGRMAALLGATAEPEEAAEEKAAPARRRPTGPGRPRKAAASSPAPAALPIEVAPMPISQATDEARPKRLMVPLSVDEDRALKEFRVADGFAAAARVRAMLALYRTDDRFRRKVDEMARQMR